MLSFDTMQIHLCITKCTVLGFAGFLLKIYFQLFINLTTRSQRPLHARRHLCQIHLLSFGLHDLQHFVAVNVPPLAFKHLKRQLQLLLAVKPP